MNSPMNSHRPSLRDQGIRFDPDPRRSYTLPGRLYCDPQIFQQEKEAIFYRSWYFVGHVSQVRRVGDFFTCRVVDQDLFVIRGKDEKLRAFYNVCQHRAHELLKGAGNQKVITCPYHAWSYHIDGRLRTARGSERVEGFDAEEFCLKQAQIEEFCSFLFINLDPGAPPLTSLTGALETEIRSYCPEIDRLVFSRRLTYEVQGNWKNAVDNFLECYHCRAAHSDFCDLVDMDSYRSICHGIYSSHCGRAGRSDNTAYRYSGDRRAQAFGSWWLWPNLSIEVFPGAPNVNTLFMIPTGPETTTEIIDFYFLDETPTEEQQGAIEYMDKVLQVEDLALVESAQRGFRSRGYRDGRFIVDSGRTEMSEHAVHHFHGLVVEALERT